MSTEEELKNLKAENHNLKEQIKKILEQDLIEQNYGYINYLKTIIDKHKMMKENNQAGVIIVDDVMITAIENLIGFYESDERYNKGE